MTRLLLVRHGETVDNVNQIMQGQTQGELTQNGVLQAEELARQMTDEQIEAYTSSFTCKRCSEVYIFISKQKS